MNRPTRAMTTEAEAQYKAGWEARMARETPERREWDRGWEDANRHVEGSPIILPHSLPPVSSSSQFFTFEAHRGQTEGPVTVRFTLSQDGLDLLNQAKDDPDVMPLKHMGRSLLAVALAARRPKEDYGRFRVDPKDGQLYIETDDTIEMRDESRGPVDAKQPMSEAEEQAQDTRNWTIDDARQLYAEAKPMNTAGGPPVFAGPHTFRISKLGQMAVSETADKIVERDFNPHQREDVNEIKELAAILITRCEYLRNKHNWYGVGDDRAKRAIEKFEEGSMLAVKAIFA